MNSQTNEFSFLFSRVIFRQFMIDASHDFKVCRCKFHFELLYLKNFHIDSDKFLLIMNSLSIYARLFARAISGTEAESILLNSLLRLSSSSASALTYDSHRLAITYRSTPIKRPVHLVTASSGYSNHNPEQFRFVSSTSQVKPSIEQRPNVFGDDAFFVAKHRVGDFLGEYFLLSLSINTELIINHCFGIYQVLLMVLVDGGNME